MTIRRRSGTLMAMVWNGGREVTPEEKMELLRMDCWEVGKYTNRNRTETDRPIDYAIINRKLYWKDPKSFDIRTMH